MKTATLDVRDISTALADFSKAWRHPQENSETRISFATPDLFSSVLTEPRRHLLRRLCGAGEVTPLQAAELAGAGLSAVQDDLRALQAAGLIEQGNDGKVVFPFDAIKVDFPLAAA